MRQDGRVNYLKKLEVCSPCVIIPFWWILISPFPPYDIIFVQICFPIAAISYLIGLFVLTHPFSTVEQKQLVAQKIHIEENEDRDTGLEQRHYKEDPDCVMAKVPLGDLDLYDGTYISLESKDIV